MPGPYGNLLVDETGLPPGMTEAEAWAGANEQYGKSGAAYNLKVAQNPHLRTENRILASEQDYQDAIGYYRAKAEEMQGREAPVMNWGQADADYAAYQQDRAKQAAFAEQLRMQAEGKGGPSIAEQQMRAGLATGQQQARAMAASARGGALAQAASNRLAMQQAGNMAGQVNQQTGVLRAQEQAQARQEYAQALAQMQGQNAQQRGLSQGQTVATAQNEAGQRQRNDQMSQGMYGQEGGARDALYSGRVSQLAQERGYATNQNALEAQKEQNAQARKDQKTSALLGAGATVAGAALMFSDVRMKSDVQPAVAGWDPKKWADTGTGVPPSVQQPETPMTPMQKMQALQMAGQFGQQLGTALSDERQKVVGTAADSPVAEQMREAPPYRYRYKDPADGTGERFGPMAQDLASTESGRSVVVETPRGLAIDGQRAIPNLLAQTATLQKQLDEMRAKLEKGRK
jgi:hypothetical protein